MQYSLLSSCGFFGNYLQCWSKNTPNICLLSIHLNIHLCVYRTLEEAVKCTIKYDRKYLIYVASKSVVRITWLVTDYSNKRSGKTPSALIQLLFWLGVVGVVKQMGLNFWRADWLCAR